ALLCSGVPSPNPELLGGGERGGGGGAGGGPGGRALPPPARPPLPSPGIQTSQDARFYALSARFEPFSNRDRALVLQFTVKHEQNIDCGGGYVKLFPATLSQEDMHGDSEYNIMFGPDICGPGTKKVHVIFNYKGKNVLINKDIRCKDDEFTHLYTLVVRPDNTYEVKIDNGRVESGSLEEDWDFLPPKKIKDPEAKKPEDWDERAKIDDPEDTKPEDWDKPEHIPDPDAKKPEDWDEEMDGEWEPPVIQNPEYKGEWRPRQIDNPDYKGKWVHPEIDNPEYSPDPLLYAYDSFGVIGLDLWQVKSGTIFDNFLITDDEKLAEEVGNETWGATKVRPPRETPGEPPGEPPRGHRLSPLSELPPGPPRTPLSPPRIPQTLWSPPSPPVKSGTIFDNFLITDDEKLAEEVGNETWGATK
ncbi:calreticulin-like, partial [Corapipo altera]|uniref:calreticulin-like n=1 Tax=Corapipo altera TaxID=415028 RepID=UPI000FD62C5E